MFALVLLPDRGIVGDSVSYDDLASRFSQGKGYTRSTASDEPDSRRLPGYPFFLAAIYFTFGHSLFAVRLIQVILDALTCVIVYKLSKEVLDDAGQALWSALLAVTYLPFILFANFILSETLYVAIVTIAIFFLVKAFKYGYCRKWFICAGFFLGISNLIRSTLVLFPMVLFVVALLMSKIKKKRIVVSFTFIILFMLLAMSPWLIRNYICFRKVALSHQGFGWALWVGSTDFKGQFYPHWDQEPVRSMIKGATSLEGIDKIFMPMALENIKHNPLGYIGLCVKKMAQFWFIPYGSELVAKRSNLMSMLYRYFYNLLFIFSIWGIIITDKRRPDKVVLPLLMAYYSVFHAVLIMEPRYALPVAAYVFILAVYGISAIKDGVLKRGAISNE